MKRCSTRTAAAVISAAVLVLGGCATVGAPSPQSDSDTPMPSASPSTEGNATDSNFASPHNALQEYPGLWIQGP